MRTILFITIIFSMTSSCLAMKRSLSEDIIHEWISKYLRYYKNNQVERDVLISYLANRMYLNRLYFHYQVWQDLMYSKQSITNAEIIEKKVRVIYQKHYSQHYNFYKNCEATLEICAITLGYSRKKTEAFAYLNNLLPAPPRVPCDKLACMHKFTEEQSTRNAQKLIEALKFPRSEH